MLWLSGTTYVKLLWVLAHDLEELLKESPNDLLDGWSIGGCVWGGVLLLSNGSIGCGHCEVVREASGLLSCSQIKQY